MSIRLMYVDSLDSGENFYVYLDDVLKLTVVALSYEDRSLFLNAGFKCGNIMFKDYDMAF
ncbi:hypothetical protein MIDIC_210005 [Alphaproteobacteria bacterium]